METNSWETIDDELTHAIEFCDILRNLQDQEVKILYEVLQLPDEKAQKRYIREKRSLSLDGSLSLSFDGSLSLSFDGSIYNALCAKVLVVNPIDYVQEELNKRTGVNKNTYYTFMYCDCHDEGFIIKGYHDYAPVNYKAQHAHNCEYIDWSNQGIVECNGEGEIEVVEQVRFDYDRFGGGFTFELYNNTLTDETGNELNMEVYHSELLEWINKMAKKHV